MPDDKIAFLSLRDINEAVRLRLHEKFLRSEQISFNERVSYVNTLQTSTSWSI
jgi:hypothetical protein